VDAVRHALFTRRGAGYTLLMVVVALGCLRLGFWQLERARPDPAPPVTTAAATALSELTEPGAALLRRDVGRVVTTSGRYLPAAELVVVDRDPAAAAGSPAEPGVWALSALRTDSGAIVPVVRGWAPDRGAVPPPPTGPQTVRGVLQPSENSASAPRLDSGPLAADEVDIISSAELVGRYPTTRLYDAFVILAPPSPGLQRVDPEVVSREGWRLLNAGYALQWWVFAGFAVFVWVRVLSEESE
jgi:surfeit locus 1 family protein